MESDGKHGDPAFPFLMQISKLGRSSTENF